MPPAPVGGPHQRVRDAARLPAFVPSVIPIPCLPAPAAVNSPFPPSPPSSPGSSPLLKPVGIETVAPLLTPVSSNDALPILDTASSFLDAVFPRMPTLAASAVPVADAQWELAVVQGHTLYAHCAGGHVDMCMRENVVELLDRAAEDHNCDGLVMCLDKKDPDLPELLHSLMYVGGTIMSPATVAYNNSDYVLVGVDI